MVPRVRRVCLALLAVAGLGTLPGCFGVTQNPSYFPYLLPTGDIIQTHAKPVGPGYYANFDPHACQVVVRPLNATNPVRTQHVLIATVLDANGNPRRDRRVEWMVEGVGHIIEVDESGFWPGRGYKVTDKYAVSYTDYCEHRITRGNCNPNDDFVVRPGQTWCVISSPVEGDTHVTAYAPGVFDWERGRVTVTCRWVDAAWRFPDPAVVPAGTEHVLTTRVFRHTDQQPLAGYRVRYRLLNDDPAAGFLPGRAAEAVAASDLSGNANVSLVQLAPKPGVNRIGIEVIRPPDPTAPSGTAIVLANGETAVEWLAPAISLNHLGPAFAGLGQEVPYTISVTNTGKVESRSLTVTNPVPQGLQYVRSTPPAVVAGNQLVWTLGRLPPGQAHTIQAVFKASALGTVTNCAAVVTEEGLRDEKCVTTQVTQAGLKVILSGPETGVVGRPVSFRVGIANPGGAPASNLVVRAAFDDGLRHESGNKSVEVKLALLNPGEQRDLQPLVLTPTKPGRQLVRVEAVAEGNLGDRAEQAVEIQEAQLKLGVAGPKKQYVGLPAEWEVRVSNPGKVPLTGVTVRNVLPPEVRFESSTEGGKPGTGEVVWEIGTLGAGEEKKVRVTTICAVPVGAAVNRATVTAEGGLSASGEAALEILGLAGLNLQLTDEGDPVEVGKRVTFRVKVTNTGSAPASGIELRLTLPPELQPVPDSARGPSASLITGQVVSFSKVESLPPKVTLEYTIEAQALRKGDVRTKAELRSEALEKGPVVGEQSTTIYEGRPPAEVRAAPVRAAVPVPLAPAEQGVPTRMPVGPSPPAPAPPPPPPPPPR